MPSGVVSTIRAYKAALAKREALQIAEMVRYWKDVQSALAGDMLKFAQSIEGEMTQYQIIRMQRYKDLLKQVRNQLDWYERYVENMVGKGRLEMAHLGVNHASTIIQTSWDSVGLPRLSFNVLPISEIESIAGSVPLRTLLKNTYNDAEEGMLSEIMRGIARGSNPRDTARAMAKGSGQALENMLRIARTEQLRSYRESSRQEYTESGVVSGYKRIATNSERTCLACLIADGQEYDLDTEFQEHVCGRCSLVPKVKGCPEVRWLTGKEWLLKQDDKKIMVKLGMERYKAWKAGANLDDMVKVNHNPTWGDSIILRSVK